MRRGILIGLGVVLVAASAALLWPRAPALVPDAPAERSMPEFEEISVASQTSQGLSLAGTVRDPSGHPVPRAEVFLAATAQTNLTSVKCGECGELLLSCRARETGTKVAELLRRQRGYLSPGATARADGEGRFRFEHLVGVSFTVWARADGFGDGVKDRAAPGEPVELFLTAVRSIVGSVADEEGRPVANARVHAVSRRVPLPHEAATGSDGVFEVHGLGQGPFYLLVEADNFLPAVVPQVEAGPQPVRAILSRPRTLEVLTRSGGAPVAARVQISADHLSREGVAKDGTARFEGLYPDQLTVTAAFKDLTALPRVVSLDERVTRVVLDLERGGSLSITVLDDTGAPVPNPELTLSMPTGDLVGRRKARTGDLIVFGPVGLGEYQVDAKATGFKPTTLQVSVRAGESPVELVMSKGIFITGRVLDEYGRPASGISILVSPVGESITADADGRFNASVPTPGLYDLHAHHSDWGGGELKVTAPASNVELHLEPRATAEVTVSSDGHRVEGADVVLWQDREASFRSDRPSGADGMVLMRGLPAGTYWLAAGHPEYLASERQKVILTDGESVRLTVDLKAGAKLVGDVVDTDGVPVSGASVTVSRRAAEPATTDGRGHFELHALKPDQSYSVDVHHPNFEQTDHLSVQPGGDPVRIIVKRRSVFRGRVVGQGGDAIRRFHIDDRDVTSADGRFELPLPSEGDRVLFAVEAVGYEPQMVDRAAAPDLGDIVLAPAPTFNGVVHDGSGGAVPDAVVSCDVCSETVLSGPDGHFALSSPPYAAQVVVTARKGGLSGTTRTAPSGSAVEVVLRGAVHLTGFAFNADATPAAGVELEAINMDRSEPITLVTSQDGSYVADVPAGSYRFSLGGDHSFTGSPVLLAQVEGDQAQLNLGPAPGSGQLTVHVVPEPGYALWVVQGALSAVTMPSLELLRVPYGQMVYQPRSETVVLQGLPPGQYTLIWGSFHIETPGGPITQQVQVPGTPEVSLVR